VSAIWQRGSTTRQELSVRSPGQLAGDERRGEVVDGVAAEYRSHANAGVSPQPAPSLLFAKPRINDGDQDSERPSALRSTHCRKCGTAPGMLFPEAEQDWPPRHRLLGKPLHAAELRRSAHALA
jgi:hypothetical protein